MAKRKRPEEVYGEFRNPEARLPKSKPYSPKPLPFGIQERIDFYRSLPSLTDSLRK